MSEARRVLYCDLDGTIRKGFAELGRWVNGPDDVEIFNGVPDILRAYRDDGWLICGITNQGGVALGHLSLKACIAAVNRTNELCGYAFNHFAVCPHHPDAKDPEIAVCWCRKPRAGLIVEAARYMHERYGGYFPPHLALMIGDRLEDMGCADAANVPFMGAFEWRNGGWEKHFRGK